MEANGELSVLFSLNTNTLMAKKKSFFLFGTFIRNALKNVIFDENLKL